MPRIRTIKPEFFTSDTVSTLPMRARLTWIGLWTHCDDYGRCRANVKLIKAAVWPLDDVTLRDITEDILALVDCGLVFIYNADGGKEFIQMTNWSEHQKVDRPSKSIIPAPPSEAGTANAARQPVDNPEMPEESQLTTHSRTSRETLASARDGLAAEGKGKEGKGREGIREPRASEPAPATNGLEPPRNCPEHLNTKNPPPCGSCKDARGTNETWQAARRTRIDTEPRCPDHEHELARNCRLCRAVAIAVDRP